MTEDQYRQGFYADLSAMGWNKNATYFQPMSELIAWANNTYGGVLSPQEMEGAIRDAYNYNGIPESGIGSYQGLATPSTGSGYGYTGGETSAPTYSPEQLQAALEAHNRSVQSINRAYQAGLLTFDEQQQAIARNRADLLRSKEQGLYNLGQSRDEGLSSNSAYFNAVSPDAFQSQSGVYNQKVLDEYGRGQTDVLNQYNRGISDQESNQTKINFAKGQFEETNQAALADEIARYNLGAGSYAGQDYSSQLTPNRPQLSQYTPIAYSANPGGQAARIAPQSPNAVQGRNNNPGAKQEDIEKYLYGR